MKKVTRVSIIILLSIAVLFIRYMYIFRTMSIQEAIRPNANEVKKVEILFNNQIKTLTKKNDVNELIKFLDKYKIKRDKDNDVIRLNNDIYMFNIIGNNNVSYIIPLKNQITIDGYNYNIVDNNIDIEFFDRYWE